MRVAKLVLAAVCVATLLAAANAWAAAVITPTSAVAYSEYGFGTGDYRSAMKTLDGLGINGVIPADDSGGLPTAHAWPPGESWRDAPGYGDGNGDGTGWIYFDLGSQKQIGALVVWNGGDSITTGPYIDQSMYGIKDCDVLVSNDASTWTPLGSYVFARAPLQPNNQDAQVFQLANAVTTQYVKFDVKSVYGINDPDSGTIDLKEVRFLDGSAALGPEVPEPGTIVLLAAGLIGLLCYAWRKRK